FSALLDLDGDAVSRFYPDCRQRVGERRRSVDGIAPGENAATSSLDQMRLGRAHSLPQRVEKVVHAAESSGRSGGAGRGSRRVEAAEDLVDSGTRRLTRRDIATSPCRANNSWFFSTSSTL